jgi:hypothetical protein
MAKTTLEAFIPRRDSKPLLLQKAYPQMQGTITHQQSVP